MMNGGLADIEFMGDLVLRATASDGGDDAASASGFPTTLLIAASRGDTVFQSRLHGIDRDVVAQK
jgi:hypothetical protein